MRTRTMSPSFTWGSIAAQGEDVMLDAGVFRNNDPKGFGDFISPDNCFVSAANHANHAPAKPVFKAALAFAIVNASDLHPSPSKASAVLEAGIKNSPSEVCTKPYPAPDIFKRLAAKCAGCGGRSFSCT